jgi:hypothetical protein
MKRPTHEQLLAGDVNCVSIINEPLDYVVDFAVKETARERADRIWRMKEERKE